MYTIGLKWIKYLLLIIGISLSSSVHAITVVASLPALSMIADQLLTGVGHSSLLLDGRQSPHGMALSPSQRQQLSQADLVLWVGNDMETWLVKPLQYSQAHTLAITDLPHVGFLPASMTQQQLNDGHHHQLGQWDMHLWLDPYLMRDYATALRDELMLKDPAHAEIYAKNSETFSNELESAINEAQQKLAPLLGQPLMTSHDAWRYFFRAFHLTQGPLLQKTPDESAHIQSLTFLDRELKSGRVSCLLREPQVDLKIIDWLKQKAPALTEALVDPLGRANYVGGYPAWLKDQVNEIAHCRVNQVK